MSNPIAFIYLDQNILSDIVNGELTEIDSILSTEGLVPVYSRTTLIEISQIIRVDFRAKIFDWLKNRDSYYLYFLSTDKPEQARLAKADPEKTMIDILKRNRILGHSEDSLTQLGLKLNGGRQDDTFKEVVEEAWSSHEQLMNGIKENAKILERENPEFRAYLSDSFDGFIENCTKEHLETYNALTKTLEEKLGNGNGFEGIKLFRSLSGLHPGELNHITGPNFIQKIWSILQDKNTKALGEVHFESIRNMSWATNLLGKEPDMFSKIVMLHAFLNYVGYWPDKKITKGPEFVAASLDGQHLAFASFTHMFITRDKRLFKKAEAIFDLLKIDTRLQLVLLPRK